MAAVYEPHSELGATFDAKLISFLVIIQLLSMWAQVVALQASVPESAVQVSSCTIPSTLVTVNTMLVPPTDPLSSCCWYTAVGDCLQKCRLAL